MEFTLTAEDGSRRWFEAIGQPIRSRDSKAQGGVVVIRDITERGLYQLQDEFLSLASHELRTPLTPLQGSLQLLLKELNNLENSDRARHYAERSLQQVRQIGRMVSDLLDVTRLQSGHYSLSLERLRLDETVAHTVEVMQPVNNGQTIHLEVSDAPLLVKGDAGRLQQVLMNLLNNALSHAPTSPHIDVRVRRVGNEAEIQVQDYGKGIPEAELPHLFSRFYQSTRGGQRPGRGLGLGLFIAKQLIDAHDGRISVVSKEGQGTTFTIRLPLVSEEAAAEQAGS